MEKLVFKKPNSIKDDFVVTFCPGCDHGVVTRIVAEVIDELDIRQDTIGIASVGCSVFINKYYNIDIAESPHGRSLALATGIKRSKPDKIVFTYQGDGDFASIGIAESIHAANRGEKVTAICINNTTYGMTGGQAGPTTLVNQITTTTPAGKSSELLGYPMKISETISLCEGVAFAQRVSIDSSSGIAQTKNAIKKAFDVQIKGLGLGFVEVLATCPTNWGLSPSESHERVKNEVSKVFPLGLFKDMTK